MIVDASAIVALSLFEPGWEDLAARLDRATRPSTHPVSIFEASLAVRRVKDLSTARALDATQEFLTRAEIDVLSLGQAETAAALDAFERFGRGRHPAQLNMGDCFSYACARLRGLPLLYKGEDVAQTDLA